jgi:hypothetical protein
VVTFGGVLVAMFLVYLILNRRRAPREGDALNV